MIIIIESKYKEKVDHLAIVFSARLRWAEAGTHVTIIPVTVGSLGCVQSNLDKALKPRAAATPCKRQLLLPLDISCKDF